MRNIIELTIALHFSLLFLLPFNNSFIVVKLRECLFFVLSALCFVLECQKHMNFRITFSHPLRLSLLSTFTPYSGSHNASSRRPIAVSAGGGGDDGGGAGAGGGPDRQHRPRGPD
jgi:hypothetical protein